MQLKDVLGEIQSDGAHLVAGSDAFGLTGGRVFGEGQIAKSASPGQPGRPAPQGGFRVSRLATFLKPSSAFDFAACVSSSATAERPPSTALFGRVRNLPLARLSDPGPAIPFHA